MSRSSRPEVWLRGPLPDVPAALMPVAHSLQQVREEIEVARRLSPNQIAARPAGIASVAFHLKHIAGSLDRLLTYAEGKPLSADQLGAMANEADGDLDDPSRLVDATQSAIDRALTRVHTTPVESLVLGREVGRARLPSTVLGLIFHAAEHAQRHAAQITTVKLLVAE